MTATERAMCTEAEDRIRELEEELAKEKRLCGLYEIDAARYSAEVDRLREALQAEAVRQGFELAPATDEEGRSDD